MTDVDVDLFVATRRSLHGIAEQLMAGPQHRQSGTIRLGVVDGGIETVKAPAMRLDADSLQQGNATVALDGITIAAIAGEFGIQAGAPEGVYADTADVESDEPLVVDPARARRLIDAYELGRDAMQEFQPDEMPVLWPEHFDLGIQWGQVNYGLSGGDSFHPTPYAYVGPWTQREGEFWNAPFGAVLAVNPETELDALVTFLHRGEELTRD